MVSSTAFLNDDCVGCTPRNRWMGRVLVAAGAYNLLFGAWAVLLPAWSLNLMGLDGSSQQSQLLWACIGMIVGVYGIGYLLAARNPLGLWPLVFVGLLGKVLGPMGFVYGLLTGIAPVQMAFVILLNDLIWWVPFAMILWQAAKQIQGDHGVVSSKRPASINQPTQPDPPEALTARFAAAIANTGLSIDDYSREGSGVLLVFVRHAGCTFCRQMLDDLASVRQQMLDAGLTPLVIHQSSVAEAEEWLSPVVPDVARISDEPRILYAAMGLPRGTFMQLFGPNVWASSVKAARYGVGRLKGDGFQMPGLVLVRDGEVIYRQDFAHAGQRADWAAAIQAAAVPQPQTDDTAKHDDDAPAAEAFAQPA